MPKLKLAHPTGSTPPEGVRGYQVCMWEATGRTDPKELAEIEEVMRQDIFHSTLDWQTREQLQEAAQLAEAVLIEMGELTAR